MSAGLKTDTNVSTSEPAFVPYVGEDLEKNRIDATTLGDVLLKAYDRHPDNVALIFPDSSWTYRELVARAMRTARGLQALGVQPKQNVGILMPTSPELVEMFFAVALCGASAVLINARYKSSELAYVIENADLVTLMTTANVEEVNFVERLHGALPDLASNPDPLHLYVGVAPKLRNILLRGAESVAGFVTQQQFEKLAEDVDELRVHKTRVQISLRDSSMMLYTSGTTSNPKGCVISHEAMVRASIVLGIHRFRLTSEDRIWSPLPLFHIAAMLPLVAVFVVGGTYMGMPRFEPGLALQMIGSQRATMLFAPFVTFLQAMAYHPAFATTDFSAVKLMNSCFAAQPKSVGELYRQAMPHVLQLGTYGMTEACGIVSTGHWGMDPELGFTRLGLPLLGVQVRIENPETAKECAVGERGEILLRGYTLFDGYYRDAEKNAASFDKDGWFHTGDLGSLDASGHLMFDSRLKDMLKVGGENVAAAEIESLLARHPAVKLAQVVGIPDPKYTEVPAAYIELNPGKTATETELIEFCRKDIAGFKVPRHIRYITEWPMSASKIQKFQLRDQLIKELKLD